MANPQAEDGHVDIANEIVEALAHFRLSGEEMQCLWVILRKTYGWHKREDKISLSQFAVMTGLKKQTAHRALKKLSSKMIIAIIKNDDGQINSFRFNKDFDKWIPSSKKIIPSSNLIKGVIKNDDKPSSKMMNTKENKETITKERKIYSEDFLRFWKAYPKKNCKKQAYKEWGIAESKPTLDDLLKIIQTQIDYKATLKSSGQFCPDWPDPERWIKNARWEDEIEKNESGDPYSHIPTIGGRNEFKD